MKTVYAPGCWDLFHAGHAAFLASAAALGDRLVVGVTSDEAITEDKGRPPAVTLEERTAVVRALRCVYAAWPYPRLCFREHLEALRPSVLAVGEGWGGADRHAEAEALVASWGGRTVRLPRTPGVSTTAIRERIGA